MSKRRSARVAVWATSGVVGAAAIGLLSVPATASVPTVEFTGGCGLLATTSSSEPDKASVTTQKTSSGTAQVQIVNKINARAATVFANGQPVRDADGDKVVVSKGGSVTLPFSAGPVEIQMVPDCGLSLLTLSAKHEAVTVQVQEAPQQPSGDQGARKPADNPGSGSQGGSGSPGKQPDAGDRPQAPQDPAAKGAVPPAEDNPSPGSDEDEAAVGDSIEAPVETESEAETEAESDAAAAPMLPTNHSRGGATTTLALVAVVCLLGVAAAALRTIVMSRAARVSDI